MKPNPNQKSYWTKKRRAEHSKRQADWVLERDESHGWNHASDCWTKEMRKTQANVLKTLWQDPVYREKMLKKMKLAGLRKKIDNRACLKGKIPYRWILEMRELEAICSKN
jgi:hypothetical protein